MSVPGWHSLAGYLYLRIPGALGRIISKRKHWFVLDEECCELLYYKNEGDAAQHKQPLGKINIQGAGISLSLEDQNQFSINSGGKKYMLVADNHESMMIWLLALQAKRDAHDKRTTSMMSVNHTLAQKKAEDEDRKRAESLPSDQEIQAIIRRASLAESRSEELNRSRSLRIPRYNSHKVGFNGLPNKNQQRMFILRTNQARKSYDKSFSLVRRASSDANLPKVDDNMVNCGSEPMSMSLCHVLPSDNHTLSDRLSPQLTLSDQDEVSCDGNHFFSERLPDCDNRTSLESSETKSLHLNGKFNGSNEGIQSKVNHLRFMNNSASSDSNFGSSCNKIDSSLSMSEESGSSHNECSHSQRMAELEFDLMSTKCELAKVLNRESSYKNTLEENAAMIAKFEEELNRLRFIINTNGHLGKNSESQDKLSEKCRIFQNQNRFLNEEVLKLSRMWQTEQMKHQQARQKSEELERQLENLKRDYLLLLQSSIKISTRNGPEILEVHLFGGSRHKERIKELLDAARLINPSLPTYEGLCKNVTHVDSLGFRHNYNSEGLILHYICRQLSQHYSNMLQTYELHQIAWRNYLRSHDCFLHPTKKLKSLVRKGIPSHCRPQVWRMLIHTRVRHIMEEKGLHYYSYLNSIAPESQALNTHRKQITLDLLRTMPSNVHFCSQNSDGVKKMQEVLQAFCLHNPTLGYCQGMNFIVGMALLFMSAEDAFWCLVAITEKYFTPLYFDQNLIGAQADQEVMKDLLRDKLPKLATHLESMEIELCTVTLNWFLAVFFDSVPFETLVRVWDCFMLEGPKVLFRFSLAILKMNETNLLEKTDTVTIMRQLKASAKLCYDVEGLIEASFKGINNFPKRKDIAAKQACYLKILKEKIRKKQIEREVLKEREQILLDDDMINQENLTLECGMVYEKDKVWLCYGKQNESVVIKVNCIENYTYPINIKFASRVMCIHSVDENLMVLGMLSHLIYAFNSKTREELWSIRVNDTVLSLSSNINENFVRIYAALADGTIVVIEEVEESTPDILYILIGSSPVTCLQVIDQKLWCGCGNKVIMLHAKSLDTIDQFQTTSSSLDHVMNIQKSEHGVWVTIRGSNLLELWDPITLTCILLFDIKSNRASKPLKDEESEFNPCRITSILAVKNTIWVGTADGYLLIYNVRNKSKCNKNKSDCKLPQLGSIIGDQSILKNESGRRQRYDSGCFTAPSPATTSASSSRRNTIISQVKSSSVSSETTEDFEKKHHCNGSENIDPSILLSPLNEDAFSSVSTTNSSFNASGSSSSTVKENNSKCISINLSRSEENLLEATKSHEVKLSSSKSLYNISTISEILKKCTKIWKAKIGSKDASVAVHSEKNGYICTESIDNKTSKRPKLIRQFSVERKFNAVNTDLNGSSLNQRKIYSNRNAGNHDHKSKPNGDTLIHGAEFNNLNDYLKYRRYEKRYSNPNIVTNYALNKDVIPFSESEVKPIVKSCWKISFKEKKLDKKIKNHNSLLDLRFDSESGLKIFHGQREQATSVDNINSCTESANGSISFGSLDFDDVFVTYNTDEDRRLKSLSDFPVIQESTLQKNNNISCKEDSESFESLTPRVIKSLCGKVSYAKPEGISLKYSDEISDTSNSNKLKVYSTYDSVTPPPGWSSFDETVSNTPFTNEISTEDNVNTQKLEQEFTNSLFVRKSTMMDGVSDTASNISFSSCELPCNIELVLDEKLKISDKPVKCLFQTSGSDELTIISCTGNLGENEGILKWFKKGDVWSNHPIIEIFPTANGGEPSNGLRSRLSSCSDSKQRGKIFDQRK